MTGKRYWVPYSTRISPDTLDRLRIRAEREGRSQAEITEEALRAYLDWKDYGIKPEEVLQK